MKFADDVPRVDVSGPEEDVPGEVDGWSGKGRCLARRCRMSSVGGRSRRLVG